MNVVYVFISSRTTFKKKMNAVQHNFVKGQTLGAACAQSNWQLRTATLDSPCGRCTAQPFRPGTVSPAGYLGALTGQQVAETSRDEILFAPFETGRS
jgi:hypothetical protein